MKMKRQNLEYFQGKHLILNTASCAPTFLKIVALTLEEGDKTWSREEMRLREVIFLSLPLIPYKLLFLFLSLCQTCSLCWWWWVHFTIKKDEEKREKVEIYINVCLQIVCTVSWVSEHYREKNMDIIIHREGDRDKQQPRSSWCSSTSSLLKKEGRKLEMEWRASQSHTFLLLPLLLDPYIKWRGASLSSFLVTIHFLSPFLPCKWVQHKMRVKRRKMNSLKLSSWHHHKHGYKERGNWFPSSFSPL